MQRRLCAYVPGLAFKYVVYLVQRNGQILNAIGLDPHRNLKGRLLMKRIAMKVRYSMNIKQQRATAEGEEQKRWLGMCN